jgi:hypothetical protein
MNGSTDLQMSLVWLVFLLDIPLWHAFFSRYFCYRFGEQVTAKRCDWLSGNRCAQSFVMLADESVFFGRASLPPKMQ